MTFWIMQENIFHKIDLLKLQIINLTHQIIIKFGAKIIY